MAVAPKKSFFLKENVFLLAFWIVFFAMVCLSFFACFLVGFLGDWRFLPD